MTFFAQSTPDLDGKFVLQLLMALLFLGQLVTVILSLSRSRQAQRREVSFTSEAVTKQEFAQEVQRNNKEHEQIMVKLGAAETLFQSALKADTSYIHEKINKVAIEVAALTKATEMQNHRLEHIDGKLDRIVEK